jgi:flavin-dependent dehydrogenase
VEAVEDGWWYSASLPDGRGVVALMTDADLLPKGLEAIAAFWEARLLQTRHTAPRLGACQADGALRVVAAGGSRSSRFAGRDWLVVGDAAVAFDPLSGQGIYWALESGLAAGRAVSDALGGDTGALDRYARHVEAGYHGFLRARCVAYRRERRWERSPFWRRRIQVATDGDPTSLPPARV